MKRFLVVLLTLVVSGSVFAQDITFSGEFKGGLTLKADKDNAYLDAWHDDGGMYGKLGFSYNGGNWGASGGLKASISNRLTILKIDSGKTFTDPDFIGSDAKIYVEPDGVSLWGGFLENNMIKVTVGQTGSDWGSGGWLDASTGDASFRLGVAPIEGLNFGFTLGNRTFYDPKIPAKDFLKETGVGVKYGSSFVTVGAGLRWKPTVSADQKVYLGAVIKPGVPGLAVDTGIQARYLEEFGDLGTVDIRFRIEYVVSILTARTGIGVGIFQAADQELGWKVPLYLKADFKEMFAPVYVEVDANVNNQYDVEKSAGGGNKDIMKAEIPVKLCYTYNFGGSANMDVFYKLSPTIYIGDNAPDAVVKHQVSVLFGYSF